MKKKQGKGPNSERWMLTYLDMITLLMAFFVILYSSSKVDQVKYQKVAQSFSTAFGGGGGKSLIGTDNRPSISDATNPVDPTLVEAAKMQEVKSSMDKYLKENNLKGSVSTTIEERGLVVSISDSLFFDSGKADIKPEVSAKLVEIGKLLNKMGNYIRVEGHTDNVPINDGIFKSNWELSAIRATTVTKLLIDKSGISPKMIGAEGYGENRPIASNSTEAGRSKNRRVDIIILNSKFNAVETNKKK